MEKQKQIEATFDILYKEYALPEQDKKHNEIISNITTLHDAIESNNQQV